MSQSNDAQDNSVVVEDVGLEALESLRTRLLDLTGRNRLINFRHTANASLRVIDELPDQLVETLLSEKEMTFLPVPEPSQEELINAGYLAYDEETGELRKIKPEPSAEQWAKHCGLDTNYEVPVNPEVEDERHADTAIQTLLFPYELEARLKKLLQVSETAIEEMGANILYIAFGFLRWFESSDSKAERLAPLFLVPVRLEKSKLNPKTRTYSYELSYSGEDIISNLSLREKLRVDFGIGLPELDENSTPEDYFEEIGEIVAAVQPRWEIKRFVSIALLNFSKLLMYLDLDPTRWPEESSIVEHPVIKTFLQGQDVEGDESAPGLFSDEFDIDSIEDIHSDYPLIDDADSSQHSALINAIQGKNLVIEGPPGTGKSQTITNLIAAAISQGKKVLFVAEKLAALEVVKSRLDAVGLGQFCLELHSHKSQKKKILEEIGSRIENRGKSRAPSTISADINHYERLKEQLNEYAQRINDTWEDTGKSIHEVLMAAARYREELRINPERLSLDVFDTSSFTINTERQIDSLLLAYSSAFENVVAQALEKNEISAHPWHGVENSELQFFDEPEVQESLQVWRGALLDLATYQSTIDSQTNGEITLEDASIKEMSLLAKDLVDIPAISGSEMVEALPMLKGEDLEIAQNALNLFEKLQGRSVDLAQQYGRDVLHDLGSVDAWRDASEQLRNFVRQEVTFADLAAAIVRLEQIGQQISGISDSIDGLNNSLPETARAQFSDSLAGLKEFAIAVDLVAQLPASLWKRRDACFDNDELDEVIPVLSAELICLRKARDQLAEIYDLEGVPSHASLKDLADTLESEGFFRWLDGDWRKAKKAVLAFRSSKKQTFKVLKSALPSLLKYTADAEAFASNTRYSELLGENFQNLETDIDSLATLRQWYAGIRAQYGVGFGRSVAVGDAFIGLPSEIGSAFRALRDKGISSIVEELVAQIESLQVIFAPHTQLRSDTTALSGENGTISKLLREIETTVNCYDERLKRDGDTLADSFRLIDNLVTLKQQIAAWEELDVDNRYFFGRLKLDTSIDADNTHSIDVFGSTLKLADDIDSRVESEAVKQFIYREPTQARFAILKKISQELRPLLQFEDTSSEAFSKLVHLNAADWHGDEQPSIPMTLERIAKAQGHLDDLSDWLTYLRSRENLCSHDLGAITEVTESGEIQPDQVVSAWRAAIYHALAMRILAVDPELERFSGITHESIRSEFQRYDHELKALQCEQIAWNIDQQDIPRGHRGAKVKEHTELVLLEHESAKQTRHIPIRQLLSRASQSLVALKPCFMMGPMSVAQYLEPGKIHFDIVVMDEASQIKPQDALGAIARGAQIVVVGDPKQLPPTSFFDRMLEDEEDPTAIEESESILDATLPLFDARRLRWHYRSQHESLIAFSNHSFYDSNLVLFPSPNKDGDNLGLKYTRVKNGCFVNRRNIEEAKIISESVREHLRLNPSETLGIVAMNSEQRQHIEMAIETLAKEDESFRHNIEKNATSAEPMFIKNLENVQGDERDVIFISMTYGPQEPGGRVFQRFGPINSDMGWRRLNVLFTRSKKRMHIFSSMSSDDILIGDSARRGVTAMREFLAYCETGLLSRTLVEHERGPDSDFEVAVMEMLAQHGYTCVPQVGVAGFFIDIAVLDPGKPSRYLMGIECDGATYHSAKSARDRDRLRQAILERLGWNIQRIWSTDWFKNPMSELKPIIAELDRLRTPSLEHEVDQFEEESRIATIAHAADVQQEKLRGLLHAGESLRDNLLAFQKNVILLEMGALPEGQQLLRPAMLEALLTFTPTSKVEFLERIPAYLRDNTAPEAGKYLETVFEIINASLEDEPALEI